MTRTSPPQGRPLDAAPLSPDRTLPSDHTLRWVDPVSGDSILLDVRATPTFVERLLSAGFSGAQTASQPPQGAQEQGSDLAA